MSKAQRKSFEDALLLAAKKWYEQQQLEGTATIECELYKIVINLASDLSQPECIDLEPELQ